MGRNDGSKKKKKKKLDFESHHESTEKKFQSEIKIKSTTIDSDLGDIDVRSIGLEEASQSLRSIIQARELSVSLMKLIRKTRKGGVQLEITKEFTSAAARCSSPVVVVNLHLHQTTRDAEKASTPMAKLIPKLKNTRRRIQLRLSRRQRQLE